MVRALAMAVLALTLPLAVGATDDGAAMYYYVAPDGAVVVTNTPSRGGLRPVPGVRPATIGVPARGADLPATPYDPYIETVAAEHGLSPSLIKAVALVESGLDARAVSPKGAQGLMQLMPATAAQYGVADAFDPLENLRAGAAHLRSLLDQFDGDLTLALAAYNAGAGAVRRHGGVPAYRETRDYVRKVHESLGRRQPRAATIPRDEPVRIVRSSDGTILLTN